jgi:hypothetical protein
MNKIDFKNILTLPSIIKQDFKSLSKEQVGKALAELHDLSSAIEVAEERLKEIVLKRGYGKMYFVDTGIKIEIVEKMNTRFNIDQIGKTFLKKGKISEFFKIVNIVQSNFKNIDGSLINILNKNAEKKAGSPYVKISKMSKDDLAGAL